MANLRQSILIRTDLNFSTGLLAAQVAHLHALPLMPLIDTQFKNSVSESVPEMSSGLHLPPLPTSTINDLHIEKLLEWVNDPYLFVHKIPNLEVLEYFEKLLEVEILYHNVWQDTVYIDISETQTKAFSDVKIGLSIGPDDSDAIKAIIGDLPLL